MDTPQAIVLGLVEGITEFLPVSRTGRLRIVPALRGWATIVATLSASVAAIAFLLRFLTTHSRCVFVPQRVVVGALVLAPAMTETIS